MKRLYFFTAALLAIGGAAGGYMLNRTNALTIWYVFLFSPSAVMLFAGWLEKRSDTVRIHAGKAFAGFITLALLCGGVSLVAVMLSNETCEVTYAGKYQAILGSYFKRSKLAAHFPAEIPSEAEQVRFSFLPQFLQGGGHLQLRCQLPAEKIQRLYDEFSRQKTVSYHGGDMSTTMNSMKDEKGLPATTFYTNDERKGTVFPDDYELMVLDPPISENDRRVACGWNHAQTHGVAISKLRNEIVYWADFW